MFDLNYYLNKCLDNENYIKSFDGDLSFKPVMPKDVEVDDFVGNDRKVLPGEFKLSIFGALFTE